VFLNGEAGHHVYNYIDKPDFDMQTLVANVNLAMGRGSASSIRIPFAIGWLVGLAFDILAGITGKTFPVSRIRIRKFCAQTVFSSKKMQESGFVPPYKLDEALVATVKHEFVPCGR